VSEPILHNVTFFHLEWVTFVHSLVLLLVATRTYCTDSLCNIHLHTFTLQFALWLMAHSTSHKQHWYQFFKFWNETFLHKKFKLFATCLSSGAHYVLGLIENRNLNTICSLWHYAWRLHLQCHTDISAFTYHLT